MMDEKQPSAWMQSYVVARTPLIYGSIFAK